MSRKTIIISEENELIDNDIIIFIFSQDAEATCSLILPTNIKMFGFSARLTWLLPTEITLSYELPAELSP